MAIEQFQNEQSNNKNTIMNWLIKRRSLLLFFVSVLLIGLYVWRQIPQPVVKPEAGWSAILPEAKQWRVRYQDSFDNNYGFWEYGAQSSPRMDGNFQILEGKYRLEVLTKGNGFSHIDIRNTDPLTDEIFYIAIDAKQPKGVKGNCGLVFHINKSNEGFKNFYTFAVEDGRFVFEKNTNKWERIIDWTPSSAIKLGESNRLAVVVIKSHFVLFINDQFVGEADDNQFTKGAVGLSIALLKDGDKGIFEFDNFEIRMP
jgi:hypothetical protein